MKTKISIEILFDLINNSTNPSYAKELVFGNPQLPVLPKEGKVIREVGTRSASVQLELKVRFVAFNPWDKNRSVVYERQEYSNVRRDIMDGPIKTGEEYTSVPNENWSEYSCSIDEWLTMCQ